MQQQFRSIFISDIHLGSRACQAKQLNNFLKHHTADTIYLIGDIIDGWKIRQNHFKWDKHQSNFVRKIFKLSTEGTKIIYIAGNHDEFLRPILSHKITLSGIELHNRYVHIGVDGRKYLVIHGDMFDGISQYAAWLCRCGEFVYDFILWANTHLNTIRHKLGFGYWSLSQRIKFHVKKTVNYVFEFEKNIVNYAKTKGFDGVICGHIHYAELKESHGILYINDGDWTESCTAVVEHFDGSFELITWKNMHDE